MILLTLLFRDLNAVAPLVNLFFPITYAIINAQSLLYEMGTTIFRTSKIKRGYKRIELHTNAKDR